uniref:Retrovirus-related Pol polyprotein from transposon TNT 1-94 n=1 Tax=Cajanus cajan TaxID=3821 RepID=A0A151QNH6_CAJCA|nr:Retrovirus-related Pol polyprotein from transposon TNT 1-94 [Cajanus cajan]
MFKLTADNFSYWKPMMEDHLYCKDLYEPITQQSKPEGKTDKDWEILNRKAVAVIRKYIDRSLFEHVSTYTNAYELWTKLESLIQKKTPRNKAHLYRRLAKLEYMDGQNMIEHLNTFKGLVNQLKKAEINIDDEVQTLMLFSSLPESWDTLIITLSNSAPEGKLSLDSVTDSLLNEESRRRERGLNNQFEANVIDNRGRSKNREKGGRGKSQGRSKSRTRICCYYCGKPGHRKSECRFLKKDQQAGTVHPDQIDPRKKKEDGTTTAVTSDDVFLVGEENYLNIAFDECIWIIDSGASFHVTPHEEFFSSYQKGDFGMVKMGNHVTSKIVGIGEIALMTENGNKLMLKEVRHVPDMRLNLISVSKLDEAGMINQFSADRWKLSRGSMIVARGKKEGSLYTMQGKICKGDMNVAQDASKELWHRRLGHMSEKGLEILAKDHLPNIKGQPLESCEDCLAGKQHRVSFRRPDDARRRKHILDLVHSDVCSTSERSIGGAQYFVTFIDDHSRKVWVYPLKTKDQVLQAFKEFHALVERATGRKLKCIRTDNGGEYLGPFEYYCKTHGIRHEKVPPKTPQMNGVAERMNRTIAEKVRSMLSHAKIPKSFWGEAVLTAADLINLSPSRPLNGEIPEEVWSGKKAYYGHLKVFGCRAFVHIPKDERTKLDAKVKECIYLRSPKDELGFRLWDPVNKKIVRSRDVIFFEDQTIQDIKKPEKPKQKEVQDSSPIVINNSGGEISQRIDEPNQTEQPESEQSQTMQEEQMETNQEEQEPEVRRSMRVRQPSKRYFSDDYVNLTDEGEPQSFIEAIEMNDKEKWLQAMEEELQSLKENETYELVELPQGRKALKNKWVFKLKTEENNTKPRYKARIVVKGCNQKKGIDFEEIFSPVVKMTSIRAILGLAAKLDLEIEQLDVKTAFLHGDLEEEIYMEQPEGFAEPGKEHLVCRLKKSLYGLKQAPRQWYKKFDLFMAQHNFKKTSADQCVFVKNYENGESIILLLYVDDMLIVGKDKTKIAALKKALSKSFAMKDLGSVKKILGMKIIRDRSKRMLWMSQEDYIKKVLERFNMHNAKSVHVPLPGHLKLSKKQCPVNEEKEEMSKVPYSSAVGSLMYAMVCTRPDIAYAVGVVSRFLSNPGKEHWNAVKWILRYLKGTAKSCLCFGNGNLMLTGYSDADMAGDVDSRKSTSGYLITFAGGAISWQSRLQKCIALSTTEAEFIAITEGCKEILWMKKFLQELGQDQESYVLYCDSQSAIHLSKNSTFHSRSKHIDVRYHWIRDVLESKMLKIEKIHTKDNGADMMTKSLPREKIEVCKEVAGLASTLN